MEKTKNYPEEVQRLIARKSGLILDARALQDMRKFDEARARFLKAAEIEEQITAILDKANEHEDATLNLVSAASCYKMAGNYTKALALFQEAMVRDAMPKEIRKKIKILSKQLRKDFEPAFHRHFRKVLEKDSKV
jgi:tetratricopeptide (TPR) repeat protein